MSENLARLQDGKSMGAVAETDEDEDTFLEDVAKAEAENPSSGIPLDQAMAEMAAYMDQGATPKEAFRKLSETYVGRGNSGDAGQAETDGA